MVITPHHYNRTDGSHRRLYGRGEPRPRLSQSDTKPYGLWHPHAAMHTALISRQSVEPVCNRMLGIRPSNAHAIHATPYSGLCLTGAPIILRHQISPCSAYSAKHKRGLIALSVVNHASVVSGTPPKGASARRLAVQPRPASSLIRLSE